MKIVNADEIKQIFFQQTYIVYMKYI